MTKVNDNNRQMMIDKYAKAMVENMDQETLAFYAHVGMMEDLKYHTNENLESEISQSYNHIFGDNHD